MSGGAENSNDAVTCRGPWNAGLQTVGHGHTAAHPHGVVTAYPLMYVVVLDRDERSYVFALPVAYVRGVHICVLCAVGMRVNGHVNCT
jgi:hypothetical protein